MSTSMKVSLQLILRKGNQLKGRILKRGLNILQTNIRPLRMSLKQRCKERMLTWKTRPKLLFSKTLPRQWLISEKKRQMPTTWESMIQRHSLVGTERLGQPNDTARRQRNKIWNLRNRTLPLTKIRPLKSPNPSIRMEAEPKASSRLWSTSESIKSRTVGKRQKRRRKVPITWVKTRWHHTTWAQKTSQKTCGQSQAACSSAARQALFTAWSTLLSRLPSKQLS